MRIRGMAVLLAAAALGVLALTPASASARAACPGQDNADAGATAQEKTMLCLVNQARKQRGLDPLTAPPSLARAAARKSSDILRCDQFSHEACGREFTYWIERSGYGGCGWAENIAYGSGSFATPRSIFRSWMNSRGHRRNILGAYDDIGIGLQVGELEGSGGAHVWTQQFGSRCD
ncbi:MAG TPA: CAP domain-containing protein [Solirubrobacterales bacterium]|nr:CAP domain-containing protein [Solirubrobacterales bacterium]